MSDIIKKNQYSVIQDHVLAGGEYQKHLIILMFNYHIEPKVLEIIAELGQEHIPNCEVCTTKRQGHTLLEFTLTRTHEIRQPIEEVHFFLEADNLNEVIIGFLEYKRGHFS